MRVGVAAGRTIELGERERGAQFEAAGFLRSRDGDGGEESFLGGGGVGGSLFEQDFAARAVEFGVAVHPRAPAFVQLAADFFDELARNTARLPELKPINVPVKVIWGEFDPYITSEVAKDRASHFNRASLHLLPGGHWVQSDLPEEVAEQMLS